MAYSIHGPKAKTGGAGSRVLLRESAYLVEVIKGLVVTMRHLVRNLFHMGEMPTVQYLIDIVIESETVKNLPKHERNDQEEETDSGDGQKYGKGGQTFKESGQRMRTP